MHLQCVAYVHTVTGGVTSSLHLSPTGTPVLYVAEVACKKAAAANVETVFSGAGKFTDEAPGTGATLLSHIVKLHYNWKYKFLQPTNKEVIKRYNDKFRPTVAARLDSAAAVAAAISISKGASLNAGPSDAASAE